MTASDVNCSTMNIENDAGYLLVTICTGAQQSVAIQYAAPRTPDGILTDEQLNHLTNIVNQLAETLDQTVK